MGKGVINQFRLKSVDLLRRISTGFGSHDDATSHESRQDALALVQELETYHAELHAQSMELRESQSQLLDAHDRYRVLYDLAPVGYATFSRLGCIKELNLTLAEYLCGEREDIKNTPFICWLARGQSKLFMQHLNKVFLTCEKQTIELVLKEMRGVSRIIRLETIVDIDCEGRASACKSGIIDVSYEKQVEIELKDSYQRLESKVEERTRELEEAFIELGREIQEREITQRNAYESEEKYQLLFSSVSEAIIFYDAATQRIIDANQAATDLYGYTIPQFQQMAFADLQVTRGNDQPACCDRAVESVELLPPKACHKDFRGNILPVELSTGSFMLKGREVVYAIIHDLQERLAAEARLKMAAKVFECASEAIMVADAAFSVVMVNQAFSSITGYESDEVMNKDARTLLTLYPDFEAMGKLGRPGCERFLERHEAMHRRKGGGTYPAWENISVVTHADGRIAYYIFIFSDVTQIKEAEARTTYLAHHDGLTNLPNRLMFNVRLEQCLQLAKRNDTMLALLFLDLDRFKYINDTMGHASGDRLLQEVAKRISGCVREQDTVARFGGDEFTVLLNMIHHEQEAANIAEKILSAVSRPILLGEKDVTVSTSIGISLFPRDGVTATDLIKAADVAMYHAKERGRHKYEFHTRELTARTEERLQLEHEIRDNLVTGNFFLCYQPQFDMLSGKISGVEALLRWRHADGAISTPEKIISIAEESSLILDLDAWVLRKACEQAAKWYREGMSCPRVAINFSAMNLVRDKFAFKVRRALEEYSLPAHLVELELTENVLQSGPHVVEELKALKELGVTLAIDDFGTGYSSLSMLKSLPIDRIKIDKSFVDDVPSSQSDMGIAQAIITMGHNLNLKVIAEGVENDAQWRFLQSIGCDEVQGFRFGRPELASSVPAYLDKIMLLSTNDVVYEIAH